LGGLLSLSHKPKSCDEVYCEQELGEYIQSLPEENKSKKMIMDMKNQLLQDYLSGDRVEKKNIPEYYKNKHGVENLYVYDHPGGYRSCYTLVGEGKVCPMILDLMTHEEYNKKFKYKKD
jgi:hypothetical protein